MRPVALGGLTITPAAPPAASTPGRGGDGAPLGLDLEQARAYARYADGLGSGGTKTVGFGLVTIRGARPPEGAPTLRLATARVTVVLGVNEGPYHRPERSGPPPKTELFVEEDRAVVFYGDEGRGAVLYDTGGTYPCGDPARLPSSLEIADATVPVP